MPDFIPEDANNPGALPPLDAAPAPGPSPKAPAAQPAAAQATPDFIPEDPNSPDTLPNSIEDQYGSGMQLAKGLTEKALQGLGGPVAPYVETHFMGVKPEDMRARSQAAGGLGTIAELGGFGAGMFTGASELKAVEMLGEGAAALTGLGEATSAGMKAAAKAAELAGEAYQKPGMLARMAAGSVKAATELAAIQGGQEATNYIVKEPGWTASSAAARVGMSSVLGLPLGGAFASVPPMWEATAGPTVERMLNRIRMDWGLGDKIESDGLTIAPWLRNIYSMVGGVSKENIDKYVAESHEIMAAPEFDDLYSGLVDQISDIHERLDQKKLNLASAKSAFQDYFAEQKQALRQAGYDAGAADRMAQEALKHAQTRMAQGLQEQAIEAAPRAFSAVQKLRNQAMELSAGATEILNKTQGELSLKPLFESIRPMQDKLYALGRPDMAENLGKQMGVWAEQYGDKVQYPNAKLMVQGLQRLGKWEFGANEMANGLTPYYNQLSGQLNEMLKEAVPAYRAAMEPTADAFQLLGKLDRYATPERATKAALGLKSPANFANEMPILRELEQATGVRFVDQMEHYANPDTRAAMTKALPEWDAAQKAAETLERLKDPETRAAMEKAANLSKAAKELERAQKSLNFSQEEKEALKGITPANLEGRLKSVMRGNGRYARETLSGLKSIPGFEDYTVPQLLDLIAVREAFEKGAMNGSRNVNLWTYAMGGLGSVIGAITGHDVVSTGGAGMVGSLIGGAMDKEGPAFVKNMLDRYIKKYGDLPGAMGASPEATKAGLAWFLGKKGPADAAAFKSTVNFIDAAKGGFKLLRNGAKAIFQGGKIIPSHLIPDIQKLLKLDEHAKKTQENERHALNIGGGLGKYMPDHAAALSETAMKTVQMAAQHRPTGQKLAPLDDELEPSPEQIREYQRGLGLAQQPLMALDHAKNGTLLPSDIQVLTQIHPHYLQHMRHEVSVAMQEHLAKDGKIPYALRQSLSLFLGENLDSSLSPANILASQSVFAAQKSQAPAPAAKTKALAKTGQNYETKEQASQARALRA